MYNIFRTLKSRQKESFLWSIVHETIKNHQNQREDRIMQNTDSATDPSGWGLSGRQQRPDAGGGPAQTYCRNSVGPETIYEYGPAEGIETRAVGCAGRCGWIDR